MKKAVVIFDQVRDCPWWCSGECINIEGGPVRCFKIETCQPPEDCPLENV